MDTTPKSEDKPTGEEKPKGINWLTIIGIVILVVLIGVVIAAAYIWNITKDIPAIQDVMALEPQLKEMEQMTLAQIEEQAEFIQAEDLAKDPYGYKDRYVIVEGTMSKEESIGVSQNIAMNIFKDENYKGYVLDDAIVAIDISGEGDDAPEGATVKAYGKLFVLNIDDVWKIPIVGPNLKQEFANVEGMSDTVVFVIARGIEVLPMEVPAPDEPLPGEMGSDTRTPDMEGADAEMTEGEGGEEGAAVEGEAGEGEAGEGEAPAEGDEPAPEGEGEGTEGA
ncbi:hypothetical protein JW859_05950 [bacterium]|nr:hypothetical protein [bacterium]